MSGCGEAVEFTRYTFSPSSVQVITTPCGTYIYPEYHYCTPCFDMYSKRHPHGWRVYPGDVCVHGTYVGSPADVQCFYCEEAL